MQEYELECTNMILTVWFCTFLVGGKIDLHAAIPAKASGHIHDFAGILDIANETELHSLATQVEQKTSAEIAVVTVASLDGMSVEEYAVKLFNQWGIGKKGKDNGVLVLVAPNERKVRIEVGYGLEPILPDGLAGEIIREQMVPAFKQGNFSGGIVLGVKRIIEILERGEPATVTESETSTPSTFPLSAQILLTLFLSVFVAIGFFFAGSGVGSKVIFLVFWGSFFGGLPFGVAISGLVGSIPQFMLPFLAISFFVWGWKKGMENPKIFRGGGKRRSTLASNWIFGTSSGGSRSFWSGGFSGGSSGGSFGGGSSGGGGASGSW